MLTDIQAAVLESFYRFSCPNRDTVRQTVYHNGDHTLKPAVEKAVEAHLEECPDCAYQTLPREPPQAA